MLGVLVLYICITVFIEVIIIMSILNSVYSLGESERYTSNETAKDIKHYFYSMFIVPLWPIVLVLAILIAATVYTWLLIGPFANGIKKLWHDS